MGMPGANKPAPYLGASVRPFAYMLWTAKETANRSAQGFTKGYLFLVSSLLLFRFFFFYFFFFFFPVLLCSIPRARYMELDYGG